MSNRKWGFIDAKGIEIVPPIYDEVESFSEGLALVKNGSLYGFIDKTGTEVVPPIYNDSKSFKEGLALIKRSRHKEGYLFWGAKYGYIDKSGKEVIPPTYDNATEFNEGLAIAVINGKIFFIDQDGNETISLTEYDTAWTFSEGLAAVKRNRKWGFIDKGGNEVVPCIYDDAQCFSKGLAWVMKDGKYGLIDKLGNLIAPFIYDRVGSFSDFPSVFKIYSSEDCAFYYDGEVYCKRLLCENGEMFLESINQNYEPIKILPESTLTVYGKVIGLEKITK
jgi:hypothetical protein